MSDARTRRLTLAIGLVRVMVAAMLFVHGVARVVNGVAPFGQWLGSLGLPMGSGVAWTVTVLELAGAPLLALGVLVVPLAAWFAAVLTTGIVLVHAPSGWFVVGAGRNGAEYSVALIVCLLAVAVAHWRPRIAEPATR